VETDNKVTIDLRPPYVFAFYHANMAWVDKRNLLYYSRKDNLLHFKHQASPFNFLGDNDIDKEYAFAIADEYVNALQEVFGMLIDAYIAYFKKEGTVWRVLDGSETIVICGKRRVSFDSPSIEPFSSFENMIYQTLIIDEGLERPDYEELRKQLPIVKERLISFLKEE